jgi:hypothetical protein
MSKMKGLLLDYESADNITVASLLQSYDNLLWNKQQAGEGRFCHPDDRLYYDEMLNALEKVIKYYSCDGDYLIKKTIRDSRDQHASKRAKFLLGNMNSLDF